MLNLILHCGSRQADRQQVEHSPTPAGTPTWVPIPHHRLLERVESSLTATGLRIINQAHALSADRLRYFGLLEVVNGDNHGDYGLVVGVRNSHDKQFPAGLAVGSGTFVCDNLCFSSEIVIARRHTRFIERDLPGLVDQAVGRLGDLRGLQDERIAKYKQTELTDMRAHHLVIRALDARVVPVTRVPDVLQEWRHPRHEEFARDGKTAWRLLNAFSENFKNGNLMSLPRRTQALHGLLDAVCGLRPGRSALPVAVGSN
ncbi:MAG: DUF932 domain-containing protein [Planctomycetota bacterium]|nr:DUF932 domain-containing protein [Planctomycetota bacterium]